MQKFIAAFIAAFIVLTANSQHDLTAIVKGHDNQRLAFATVSISSLNKSTVADSNGIIILKDIPTGKHTLVFSHVGYEDMTIELEFPVSNQPYEVELEEAHEEEEEVIITSTRTSRTIANTPTRVETISGEELDEKSNMKPGDIRMLLSETTGIQTQQTSATSYNYSIRIQGLDGRYTQLVKDGFPLYGGFSGGLSIMQVAPLDLRQVEVVKGSTSTLYGGGAIAGLVNLVSKTPGEERTLDFLANATSANGLDLSAFYAQKFDKFGITVFGSRNSSGAYDPADIGLSAIPQFRRYTINPRFFFYASDRTEINAGIGFSTEERTGGSMEYIKSDMPGYFEKNNSDRLTSQIGLRHALSENKTLNIKTSFNSFSRKIEIPDYIFEGDQFASFSEASLNIRNQRTEWIFGLNAVTDKFEEVKRPGVTPRDYTQNTFGAFLQNTVDASDWLTLETGLRGDYVNDYGFNLLPRLSALFRINQQWTSRLGGGLGYKAPTVFTEEAEKIQFQNVLPIDPEINEKETSYGLNFDFNYWTRIFDDEVYFSWNQLFFYTRLNHPLILTPVGGGNLAFINSNGHIDTRGIETNLKFIYRDFKLFVGYTFAEVNKHEGDVEEWMPLSPRHRLNNVLMYEKHEKWKIGLEAYYFSPQKLSDGTGQSYWVMGFMTERLFPKFSIYVNFENFTDSRQTKFDTIYTGPITDPVFRDIYAPVDGFVINGGIKLRF